MTSPTEKKQFQNTRHRMKTYSKYFMWIWIILTILTVYVSWRIQEFKKGYTILWDKVNNLGYRIDRLEANNE